MKTIREGLSINQRQFAELVHTPQSIISDIELGKRQAWPSLWRRIARVLKTPGRRAISGGAGHGREVDKLSQVVYTLDGELVRPSTEWACADGTTEARRGQSLLAFPISRDKEVASERNQGTAESAWAEPGEAISSHRLGEQRNQ